MLKQNNVILKTTTSLIAFILLGFAVYLLFAGHDSPGGGFVGGLMTSAAIILLYMAYGIKNVNKIIPIDFKVLIPIGLLLARSEEHTSELQSRGHLVCRLLLEK